jgi:tetratricopeptide (TPR) repeat protein
MRRVNIRFLGLLVTCIGIVVQSGCHNKQAATAPAVPDNHARALAVAAQGSGYLVKEPERSVEYFKQAVQLEPANREWKAVLALAYYKALHPQEAIPIWQELAHGNDDFASQSKRFLAKVGAKQ